MPKALDFQLANDKANDKANLPCQQHLYVYTTLSHVLQSLPPICSWARFCCAAHIHRSRLVLCAGGPAGGNGGSGGNVWVQADDSLNSLTTFRKQVHYRADNGRPGGGSNMTGANAEDLIIKVSHADQHRTFCMRCVFAPVTSLVTFCCCFCLLTCA